MNDHEIHTVDLRKMSATGIFDLPASKSLTNRALLIQYLAEPGIRILNASQAEDSRKLKYVLRYAAQRKSINAGIGGTTYRFALAGLAARGVTVLLRASGEMNHRPIAPLVQALSELGASLDYIEDCGYPPIQISSMHNTHQTLIKMSGDQSSQFISAMLMVGGYLPQGLHIQCPGKPVSAVYIQMTIALMRYFGASVRETKSGYFVDSQGYTSATYQVESDWSAASYAYAIIACHSSSSSLRLPNIRINSLQGDSACVDIFTSFGVTTQEDGHDILISKRKVKTPRTWSYNFINQPDLVMTLAVVCALKRCTGTFTGVRTLKHKETNRITALARELPKIGGTVEVVNEDTIIIHPSTATPGPINTYNDHRIAMAFAVAGTQEPVQINQPNVVKKSFPSFWESLSSLQSSY